MAKIRIVFGMWKYHAPKVFFRTIETHFLTITLKVFAFKMEDFAVLMEVFAVSMGVFAVSMPLSGFSGEIFGKGFVQEMRLQTSKTGRKCSFSGAFSRKKAVFCPIFRTCELKEAFRERRKPL